MIDHVGINVSDYAKSKAFYAAALGPVGYEVIMEFGGTAAGLGFDKKPFFWITQGEPPTQTIHIAFHTEDREVVDAFHAAALAAGGRDNGEPGLRPHYHENYYAAFVFDPDGNNIEVVCHLAA